MTGAAFVVSRTSVPDITSVWQVLEVLAIYLLFSLGSWFIFSVRLGNILFNGKAPRSNEPWLDQLGHRREFGGLAFAYSSGFCTISKEKSLLSKS